MSWSDAEKEYQERLAAQAREREADLVKRIAAREMEIREAQAKQQKIKVFLAAMHQAGNPGLRYHSLWNWLIRKGYWMRYPGRERIQDGEWICTDGSFRCLMPDPWFPISRIDADANALATMLVEILHRHNVPIPADSQPSSPSR